MDALLAPVQDVIDGPIDFEGQRIADLLNIALTCFVAGIAFVAAFWTQDIHYLISIGLPGLGLVALLIVPPWPIYKRDPVDWKTKPGMDVVVIEDSKPVSIGSKKTE